MFGKIKWLALILPVLFFITCTLGEDLESRKDPGTVTVTFNANGSSGSPPATQTGNIGASITLPNSGSLTKENHAFGGWNTNAGGMGTNYSAGESFNVPKENITLFARWIDTSTTHRVIFDINNGIGTTPPMQMVKDGSSIILPNGTGFSQSGHIFFGWNTQADGRGIDYSAGASFIMQPNDITLYAKWVLTYKDYPIEGTFTSGGLGTSYTGFNRINNISDLYKDDFDIASLKLEGYTKVKLKYNYTITVWGDIEYQLKLHNVTKNKTFVSKSSEKLNGDNKSFSRDIECTINLSELETSQTFDTLEIQSSYRKQKLLWGGDFKILNRRLVVTFSKQ